MDKTDTVYIFKVTLNDTDWLGTYRKPFTPKIWRRIHLPSYANFSNLHDMIQDSMGWVETHMHHFEMKHAVNGTDIELVAEYDMEEEFEVHPSFAHLFPKKKCKKMKENAALISEYFTLKNRTAAYTYDFGDNWDHTVELEEIVECKDKKIEGLACVAGEGVGPPEDSGGAHGYRELVKILKNPRHPEHKESKNWVTNSCSNPKGFFDKIVKGYKFDPADVEMRLVLDFRGNIHKTRIYVFKITLKGTSPKVWRRLHVPGHYTFANLHDVIQDSMGFVDCHLHNFEMSHPVLRGKRVELVGDTKDIANSVNENKASIFEYFTLKNRKADYTYDYGDNWEHTIELEKIVEDKDDVKIVKKGLACVAGEGLGPLEDCGGTPGYLRLLKILKNKQDPEHGELKDWVTGHCVNGFGFFEKVTSGYKFRPAEVKFRLLHRDSEKNKLFVFKITLDDTLPNIWRRIHLPAQATFANLHAAIQDSMGWADTHLHNFEIKHPVHGKEVELVSETELNDPNMNEEKPNLMDESKANISEYFTLTNRKAVYTYDFGDNWVHTIELETTVENKDNKMNVLACVAGEGLAPPEDCGGVLGFYRLLEILGNTRDRAHKDEKGWLSKHCLNGKGYFEKFESGYKFNPADIKMRLIN